MLSVAISIAHVASFEELPVRAPLAFVAVFLLALLSCGRGTDKAVIAGRVVGADGKAPLVAHVHLVGLGDNLSAKPQSARAASDGSFRIDVPLDRYYELVATAVNHQAVEIPLLLQGRKGIKDLEVRLPANQFRDPPTGVAIIGDWNGFDSKKAEPLEASGGKYIYSRDTQADTLAYQLVNAVEGRRTVNGTQADHYIYDGGGDYISVLRVVGGKASVVFDPEMGVKPASDNLPRITVGGKDHPLSEVLGIAWRWSAEVGKLSSAYQAYYAEHGNADGFQYDPSDLGTYLRHEMAAGKSEAARRYAAVKLAQLPELGGAGAGLSKEDLATIMKTAPVTDGVWADSPTGLVDAVRRAVGDDEMVHLFERGLDKVTDKKVEVVMLLEIGLRARDVGDSTRQAAIYDQIIRNYSENEVPAFVRYRIKSELDPHLKVTKGRPMPYFELALLDGGGTVSNKTLLGRYCLIELWATWCGPCIREMPNLHEAYQKYGGPKFEILSISLDKSPEDAKKFRNGEWKMPWLNAYAEGVFNADIVKLFEVVGIPRPILVDPNGVIVATGAELRGDNLEKTLAQYLGG